MHSTSFLRKRPWLTILPAIIAPFLLQTTQAADGTWITPGGGSWSDPVNWSGGTIADGSGFTAYINSVDLTANSTITLDGNRTIGGLVFGDITPSHSLTIAPGAGGTLTLANTGNAVFNVLGTGVNITTQLEGSATLEKTGGGVLTLNQNNSGFTGKLVVKQGFVGINATSNVLGASLPSFVADAITLDGGGLMNMVGATDVSNFPTPSNLTIEANRGITLGAAGGTIRVGHNNYTLTIQSVISGGGMLTVTDNAATALNNTANTYSGGTQVVAGATLRAFADGSLGASGTTISLNNGMLMNLDSALEVSANRLIVAESGGARFRAGWNKSTTIHSQITGVGNVTVTNDSGIVTLTNVNNDYAGRTIIGGTGSGDHATLRLGTAGVIPDGSIVEFASTNGNRVLDLNGHSESVSALTSNAATGTSIITTNAPGNVTLTITNGNSQAFNGSIRDGSGVVTLVKAGGGAQILNGISTYTGGTVITGGNLQVATDAALGAANGGITLDGGLLLNYQADLSLGVDRTITLGASGGRIRAGWGQTVTVNSKITGEGGLNIARDSGVVILTNTGNDYQGRTYIGVEGIGNNTTLRLGNSNVLPDHSIVDFVWSDGDRILDLNGFSDNVAGLSSGATTGTSIITNTSSVHSVLGITDGNSLTFNGSIRDGNGVVSVVKNGNGTQTLSGVSTYTGGTTINGGFLRVNQDAGLGATTGTVTLNGGTLMNNDTVVDLHAHRTLILGNSGGSFRAGWNKNITVHGQITGVGNLTVVNDGGALVLNNTLNNYAGKTIIGGDGSGNNATLRLGNAHVLPDSTQVEFAATAGARLLDLNGNSENVSSLSSTATTGSSTVSSSQAGNVTLGIVNGDGATFNGVIQNGSGVVSVRKSGSGTQRLTGNNTYTGTTDILDGTLQVDGSLANSVVSVGGQPEKATLSGSGTVNGPVTVKNNGVLKPGDGSGTTPLKLNQGLVFETGSSFEVSPIFGAGTVLTRTSGNVNLNGAHLIGQLGTPIVSGTPTTSDLVWLIDSVSGTTTGTFANGQDGTFWANALGLSADSVDLVYNGDTTLGVIYGANFETNSLTGGSDVAVFAIPEPNKAMLMILAAGSLLGLRRRKIV